MAYDEDDIDIHELQNAFNDSARHDINMDNTAEIVDILGGINCILEQYVEHNPELLNQSQILELYKLFTRPVSKEKNILKQMTTIRYDKNKVKFTHVFNTQNTILHSFLSNKTATKIRNFAFNKKVGIANMLAILFYWVYRMLPISLLMLWIYEIILCGFGTIWSLSLLLSANKRAFKMVLETMEFWIKFGYTLLYFVTYWTYRYGVSSDPLQINPIRIISQVLISIIMILCVIIISSLDASRLSIGVKIFATIVCSLLFTMTSIYFTFWAFPNSTDDSIIHLWSGFAVSLRDIISSSFRVLTIFFWAQTIKTIKNKRKFKCIIIHYNPYIKWEDDHNDEKPVRNQNETKNRQTSVPVPVTMIKTKEHIGEENETDDIRHIEMTSLDLDSMIDDMNELEIQISTAL